MGTDIGWRTAWKPIETAPKDRRILLRYNPPLFLGIPVVGGKWNEESFHTHPIPHWENDKSHLLGVKETRRIQPTEWMEIPE